MLPGTSNRIEDRQDELPPHAYPRRDTEADAAEHARTVTRSAGSSFYWAMRLLPAARREAMFAIYAFCREVDDIADGDLPGSEKRKRLDAWRAEIHRVYAGSPETVTGRALLPAVRRYGMKREDFLAIIDGMEMDADGLPPGPPMKDLETYCSRVAGAVGLLSIHAFGAPEPRCRDFALHLGTALQLTNILRDVAQDAAMGRCYLPDELLRRHGIETRDPSAVLAHPALPLVCRDLATIAEERYAEARGVLTECPRRALRPAIVMMNHYERILHRLIASGWRHPERRETLSRPEKLWIALRYGLV